MHAGLLAPSGDIRTAGGLGMAGTDVESLLAESPVAHGVDSFLEIGDFFLGAGGGCDGRGMRFVEVADEGLRVMPEKDAFELAILTPDLVIRELE